MTRARAAIRLAAWLAGELAVLAMVLGPVGDRVATAPVDRSLAGWWTAHEPLDAAAGTGKLIVALLTTYLVAVTSLHLISLLVRGRRLHRVATAIGPRFLAGVAATATLATGAAVTAGPAGAADAPAPAGSGVRMEVVSPDAQAPSTTVATTAPTTAAPSESTSAPTTTILDPVVPGPPAQQLQPEPPPPPAAEREAIVQPGDSMWTIARDEVASRLGRTPTNAEIDPYWRALIATNRNRLVHRSNPSLIYPGQSFVLP